MKCAKCQIRDAAPNSLYCSKCQKGFYESKDPFYQDCHTFDEFYKKELEDAHPVQKLALLDDVLLTYRYYKEFEIFVPVLCNELGYSEEHSKAEQYFYDLFSRILEERLRAVGRKLELEELKRLFSEFRRSIWSLTNQSTEKSYFGVEKTVLLFIRKILRSKNIDVNTDFVENLGNFFDPGSAVFILELFAELASLKEKEDAVQNFVKITTEMNKKYGDNALRKIVNFPVVLLKPWKHQNEAFDYWCKHNFRGIIEMATATGKTLVGLMAIQKLSAEMEKEDRKGTVLITSHSRAILNQWKQEVIDKLGLLADYSDYKTPVSCDCIKIEFDTIQSLIRRDEVKRVDLLIVDEVHHIAAPVFRKVFDKIRYDWFMGLSASPEEGYRATVFKELGFYPPVYKFDLRKALEEGVLPTFDWYLHPVYISQEEMEEFTKLSDQIRKGFFGIKEDGETKTFLEKMDEDPDSIVTIEDFIRIIEKARYKKIEIPENWKKLALLVTQRRWLIHRSMPKIDQAVEMARDYYLEGKKVIVFAMDINSCEHIKNKLSSEVDDIFVVHSGIPNPTEVFSSFKRSKHGILIGARMLDEGINIPDAEIGLNVAASKTRIQLVQRLGRILRKYGDKKPVFHHFVGIPQQRDFIEFEDPFWMLDEVSWVLDTALGMGVNAKVVEGENVKGLIRKSEEKVRQYSSLKPVSLPSYGVLKLGRILSQFTENAVKKLISLLDAMPEEKQITNEEWLEMIRQSFEEDGDEKESRSINVRGHWWILILGDRNPRKIREMLSSAV